MAPQVIEKIMRQFFISRTTRHAPLLVLLFLTSCGFQPLHGRDYRDNQAIDLSSIIVTVDPTRSGQLLEAEIKDVINPTFERREKLYTLKIKILQSEERLFINPDGSSGRSDIPVTSSYTLARLIDGQVLDAGAITRVSSYNTSQTADYSSYVSLQDAKKRAIIELAQSYKLRLSNVLAKANGK
jgi:hypothetical protein